MPVSVIGLSHRTSPVEIREGLAFSEDEIPDALQGLRGVNGVDEAVILSTCNRVEVYVAGGDDFSATAASVRRFLGEKRRAGESLEKVLYSLNEPASLVHLFRVASGLDSMMLGETEILGQLKRSYQLAFQARHTGRFLNKAFQQAFNVAKKIRTDTNIQRGRVSVASAAVELAEKIFSSLRKKTVMVIGAGDTSEKTARALLSRGAESIVVTNRSLERAEALATVLAGRAVPFDEWESVAGEIDIVISSTSAPTYVLNRARLEPLRKKRRNRPLLLIDIAVPRDIDPDVNRISDVYLYNIDDLRSIADDAMRQRREETARCEAIIRERVAGLLARFAAAPRQDARTSR